MRLALRLGPVVATAVILLLAPRAGAVEIFVAPSGTGDGTEADPLGSVQRALDVARDGDVVTVLSGTYAEALATRAPGVTIRAASTGEAVVTSAGRALEISHERITVDGLVIDGQYGADDAVRVGDGANRLHLYRVEVRRAGRDCVDMGAPSGVLIEDSLVHHCLWASTAGCATDDCRQDAHGIVAGPARDLTIRGTEIHSFSGDAVQLDPGRSSPGWNDLTIEGCRFWLGPLAAPEGGFQSGVVPGENAVDTKTWEDAPERARLMIRDTVAYGFRGGLISNMAAFNLKENIDAVIDGVTVWASEIAFRTRGQTSRAGAWVRIQNAVVYDVNRGIRFEDDIENLRIWSSTFGRDVAEPIYRDGSASASVLDLRNVLVFGAALPGEVPTGSNLAVGGDAFVGADADDYHLVDGSLAIDAGETIPDVQFDRDGIARPQGRAYDVGAYEAGGDPFPGDGGADADAEGDGDDPPDGGAEAAVGKGDGCGCTLADCRPNSALLLALLVIAWARANRVVS